MKKLLAAFIIIFLVFPVQAQFLEEYESYDVDTNTIYYTLKDSQTGVVIAEGTFVNRQKSGTWYQYYPSGKLQFVQIYKQGVKSGTWKSWDLKGRMTTKLVYKKGKLVSSTTSRYY
jgi:antitoxin component YwqK of YwqJK toxin-antitoxin module